MLAIHNIQVEEIPKPDEDGYQRVSHEQKSQHDRSKTITTQKGRVKDEDPHPSGDKSQVSS